MKIAFSLLSFLFVTQLAISQSQDTSKRWYGVDTTGLIWIDSITRAPFTLVFINKDTSFNQVTKQRMVETFFKVYPQQVNRFNPNSLTRVVFFVDPAYKGVAAAGRGIVRYNPSWFVSHPDDIDVVTHEVMHIVQSYGRGAGPGWLTEDIADYVREKYGVDNATGKWALPKYDTSH